MREFLPTRLACENVPFVSRHVRPQGVSLAKCFPANLTGVRPPPAVADHVLLQAPSLGENLPAESTGEDSSSAVAPHVDGPRLPQPETLLWVACDDVARQIIIRGVALSTRLTGIRLHVWVCFQVG